MTSSGDTQTVRLAQVGIGYWGKNLLRNFSALPNVEMVMACDRHPDIIDKLSKQYPDLPTTDRYEDLLERDEVDAVVISTETPLHFPMAEAALKAGKHVFVEKPMAQTTEEAERLVALAEANDRRLMVGHLLLYHPAFRYVEDLIKVGELGEIYYLYSMRVNLGIVRQRENAFESLAPHDLSVALAFLNEKPTAVSAQGHAYLQPNIEDVAFATVYFEGGKLAHLHTSWLDPHKVRKVTVVGSKQMAVIDDTQPIEKVRLYDKSVEVNEPYPDFAQAMTIRSGDIHIPPISGKEPLRLECEHFVDCIRTGQTPRSCGNNGLAVVRLLEAAHQSLKNRGTCIDL